MNARLHAPTRPDSIPDQLSQIEDVITKRPDAVVFVPWTSRPSRRDCSR
jgi:ribose transport system substrate-binding protein